MIIERSVGRNGINDPIDVLIIQYLLRTVRAKPLVEVNGYYDNTIAEAIGDFQRACDISKSMIVEPGYETLDLLYKTVKPNNLRLNKIKLMRISEGGYDIKYEKDFIPPNEYMVMLYLEGMKGSIPEDAIDITHIIRTGYMDKKKLIKLLDLIGSKNLWSKEGVEIPKFCVYLTRNGHIISSSNPQPLSCPVKPYEGPIRLDMIDPPMYYTGDGAGRYFYPEVINGKRYFAYAKEKKMLFETEEKMRGFDCSTYVGTVLALPPSKVGGTGDKLAEDVDAENCYEPGKTTPMMNINSNTLKNFFTNNREGAFIVWTRNHVVLVVNSVVHEYNLPNGLPGYYNNKTVEEQEWRSGNVLNIKRIPPGKI